jgi:coenzyme F420-reducing hydrogenase delta subunit
MSRWGSSASVAGGAAGLGLTAGAGSADGLAALLGSPPGGPVVVFHCDGGSLRGEVTPSGTETFGAPWIRVPCVGRVSEGELLRALRGGAAGVLLVGCAPGRCRFHTGDRVAEEAVARVQGVLVRHGLSPQRVALVRPSPDATCSGSSRTLLAAAARMEDEICTERQTARQEAGRGWMRRAMPAGAGWPHHGAVQEAALLSLQAQPSRGPAPRWATVAPSAPATAAGPNPPVTDPPVTDPPVTDPPVTDPPVTDPPAPEPEGAPVAEDLLYGCVLSDLDDLLGGEFGARGVAPQQAALGLLRAAGLSPAVTDRMPACGHDFALSGDHQALSRLAGGVAEALRQSGASRVITMCPECEATLRRRYPRVGVTLAGDGGLEVGGALDLLFARRARLRFAPALPVSVPVAVFADVDEEDVEATERRQEQAADLLQQAGYDVVARLPDPYAAPGAQGSAGVEGFVTCDAAARAAQDRLLSVAQEAGAAHLLCVSPLSAIHLGCAQRRGSWRRHRLQVATIYEALAPRFATDEIGDEGGDATGEAGGAAGEAGGAAGEAGGAAG